MKKLRFTMEPTYPIMDTNEILKIEKGLRRIVPKTHSTKLPQRNWFCREIECLKRATRKDFIYNGSFHEAIGSVLALAQCFAVMPVVGVKGDCPSKLKFEWYSFRTIYSMIIFSLLLLYAGLTIFATFSREIRFDAIIPFVFYLSSVYGMFRFMIIARKWPMLMQLWESVEAKLPNWQYQREKRKLAYQIKMTAFVILLCSLGN